MRSAPLSGQRCNAERGDSCGERPAPAGRTLTLRQLGRGAAAAGRPSGSGERIAARGARRAVTTAPPVTRAATPKPLASKPPPRPPPHPGVPGPGRQARTPGRPSAPAPAPGSPSPPGQREPAQTCGQRGAPPGRRWERPARGDVRRGRGPLPRRPRSPPPARRRSGASAPAPQPPAPQCRAGGKAVPPRAASRPLRPLPRRYGRAGSERRRFVRGAGDGQGARDARVCPRRWVKALPELAVCPPWRSGEVTDTIGCVNARPGFVS